MTKKKSTYEDEYAVIENELKKRQGKWFLDSLAWIDFDDVKQPTDFVLEEKGLNIFIDPMSLQYLNGTKVDYIESFQYTGFHFENPNAKSTCGCGSSFTI